LNSQPSSTWETPASIACVYNLVTQVSGCPITSTTALPTGGGVIAIVDAYDDPNAASDLTTFSSYFNLPSANFQVVYATGVQPQQDTLYQGTWELEESLDIEWAHAMAPYAKIILVEAASDSYTDLMAAEKVAGNLVSSAGGGVVSNSWGGAEFNGSSNGGVSETSYDQYFVANNVVFTASTGDYLYLDYPAASPNVVAVGGTSLSRDSSGNFIGESYWYDPNNGLGGGGGLSQYESIPSYQSSIQSIVGSQRGVPDLSSDADPASGVAIYDSFPYVGVSEGWYVGDGTSLASPTIAGRVSANGILSNTGTLQNYIYGEYAAGTAYSTNFNDITSGTNSCVTGWDICSGIGSPLGAIETVTALPIGTIDTVAGNGTAGSTGDGGVARIAELYAPTGVAVDYLGNIYIADYYTPRLREVTASTGDISTIVGSSTFGNGDGAYCVGVDGFGSLVYFSDNYGDSLSKLTLSTDVISTVATESSAPSGVAVDGYGNIYFVDTPNNVVRKITASTGTPSIIAGNGTAGYSGDGGPATSAELNGPAGVAVSLTGYYVYITDRLNNRIRMVSTQSGLITTVAGNGTAGYSGDGGAATSAEMHWPIGVAVDTSSNIYIADYMNNVIRMVTASTGLISTIAGNGTAGYSGDGGLATNAELDGPTGVAVNFSSPYLFIADTQNHRIRSVYGY
jgi:hypothetical protein